MAEISSQRYFYFCLFNWFQDTYFFNCIIYFHSDRWFLPSSFSFIFLLDISCLLIEIARLHGRYNIQNIYLYLSQPLMKYIFMFSDYSFSFSFFFYYTSFSNIPTRYQLFIAGDWETSCIFKSQIFFTLLIP